MAIKLADGKIKVEAGDTLYGIYGPNWKQLSGYTGEPRNLQIGTILPAVNSVGEVPPAENKEKTENKNTKADILAWLKTQDNYNQLPPELQADIISYIDILDIQDTDQQKRMIDALMTSKSTVDPYYKEIKNITAEELSNAIGSEKGDFAYQQKTLTQKIQDLKDDLALGTGRLTIDEQAQLKKQKLKYESDLITLTENAANAGLDFSTKRAMAESKLAAENTDIVESTKREFQRKIEDLQIQANRGDLEAKNKLSNYERIYGENVTKLGLAGEEKLGTAGLPALEGYKPMGNISGTLPAEQRSSILTGAGALLDLNNPLI
jgi:hypothetical protein